MMRTLLSCLSLLLALGVASGQTPDAEVVLDEVVAAAEALEDASFLLTGAVVDPDGTELALEIEMQVVPGARAASAYIVQPDALADNIIVLDGDAVYNYTFLTHQVTIFDADDPDALGQLLGQDLEQVDEDDVPTTFDLERLFAGYDAAWLEAVDTPRGRADRIRLTNVEEDAAIANVEAVIPRELDLPVALTFHQADGSVLAELRVEELRTDVGLDPGEVTYLPDDAEIIDERSQGD